MLKCQTVLTAEIKDDETNDYFRSTHILKMGHEVIYQGQGNFRVTLAILEPKQKLICYF